MKLCEFENCKKEATYALYFNKPILCREHKKDGMKTKTCVCVCGKATPAFGLKNDNIRSCCKNCKTPEMINLIDKNRLCKCGTRASFGLKTDIKPTYCKNCKTENMIDLINKDKLCSCGKQPIFGLETDERPSCCSKCRTPEMIDIKNKKCSCGKNAIFGLETDKRPSCCSKCKTPDMIDIKNKKCKCGKAKPYFGLKTDVRPSCCKNCKTEDMFNIVNNKCKCGTRTNFGLPNDKIASCCSKCRTLDMIDIKNKKCKCGNAIPYFGLPNDERPSCCSKCRTPEMIDTIHKKCRANQDGIICPTTANRKYKGYCTNCYANLFPNDPLTFQIRSKTKEIAVRDYINANFEGFHHDKPLWIGGCDCTHKRRIDHRKLIGNTLLCIETDEEQHKKYNKNDEEIRYDDLMMIHGSKFIFIRFNPDKYKEKGKNKNPTISTRLPKLKEEIEKQIKRIENEENIELLEEIFMYYDN